MPFCCRRTNTAPCGADKHPWYSNGASSKEPACQCRRHKRCAFDPWVGKIPLERAWQPTLVFLLGEPTDRGAWWAIANRVAESDRIEATQPTHNIKIPCSGTLLMVQWPRSPTPNAEDLGSIPGQGTRSHMPELRSSVAKISKQLKKLPCSFFRYQSCLLPNCFSSVQSLSHVRLCDPMNCSTPGFPVHHQLLEFTQTHVHRVGDAIQPSHPLLSPSPPAPNPCQHQGLFH